MPDWYRVPRIGQADWMYDDHGAVHTLLATQYYVILLDSLLLFHNNPTST